MKLARRKSQALASSPNGQIGWIPSALMGVGSLVAGGMIGGFVGSAVSKDPYGGITGVGAGFLGTTGLGGLTAIYSKKYRRPGLMTFGIGTGLVLMTAVSMAMKKPVQSA